MNTGLQDAFNLAWKLAVVSQGKAKDTLLDTYNNERLSIAQNLVRTTDRVFNLVTSKDPLMKGARMHVIPILLQTVLPLAQGQQFLREAGFKAISEIGIHYQQSELSQTDTSSQFPKHAPKPGDRVPYLPTTEHAVGTQDMVKGISFHFILFSGEETPAEVQELRQKLQGEYPDLVEFDEIRLSAETKELYARFGIERQGYYLVRPDNHIAYRSASLDMQHFNTYMEQFFLRK